VAVGDDWRGYTGYLDAAMLREIAPDFLQREIFCCGPGPYMAAMRDILRTYGFDMRRYHEENFVTPSSLAGTGADAEPGSSAGGNTAPIAEMTIEFSRSRKTALSPTSETIHSIAAKSGLYIPKGCGQGVCGTCRVRKISGEVEMSHNGGISDDDVEAGYVLSCCSYPRSDVSIDY
jgi:glycine betaine catabolism B